MKPIVVSIALAILLPLATLGVILSIVAWKEGWLRKFTNSRGVPRSVASRVNPNNTIQQEGPTTMERNQQMRAAGAFLFAGMLLLLAAVAMAPVALADGLNRGGKIADSMLPEPAMTSPWTGFWASANLSYTAQSTALGPLTIDAKDFAYGLGVGGDVQIKGTSLVLGVMADVDWTKADSMIAKYRYQWFTGARAGLLLSKETLFYGLVGYTSLDGSAVVALPFSVDYKGLTLGAGLESKLTKNWALKAEYRYVDLGSDTIAGPFAAEHTQNQARLGLVYRFNQ